MSAEQVAGEVEGPVFRMQSSGVADSTLGIVAVVGIIGSPLGGLVGLWWWALVGLSDRIVLAGLITITVLFCIGVAALVVLAIKDDQ